MLEVAEELAQLLQVVVVQAAAALQVHRAVTLMALMELQMQVEVVVQVHILHLTQTAALQELEAQVSLS
jgi:hypothetical protein